MAFVTRIMGIAVGILRITDSWADEDFLVESSIGIMSLRNTESDQSTQVYLLRYESL